MKTFAKVLLGVIVLVVAAMILLLGIEYIYAPVETRCETVIFKAKSQTGEPVMVERQVCVTQRGVDGTFNRQMQKKAKAYPAQ